MNSTASERALDNFLERNFSAEDLETINNAQQQARDTDHLVQRAAPRQTLIYKTHHPAEQQPPQHQAAAMGAEAAAAWNAWADARVLKVHDEILRVAIAEFVCEYTQKHLAKIREEIASLRADLTVQSGIARGEIRQLKQGKADAA